MSNKLYLIGNSHIDAVWLWRWQEGFSEIISTFRSALDRMKDFPDFKFTSAASAYYELIEKVDPDMFEEIRQRVKEGRWTIVGGMFLQPDCNIPDGESFARQLLVGQRYFHERFGITAKTGYNVDSFGHSSALPKILSAAGMENYVFMRPNTDEQGRRESLFVWESDDESRLYAFRVAIDTLTTNQDTLNDNFKRVQDKACEENVDLMAFYGVGNHGGGPTIELIKAINELHLEGAKYSSPDEYFEEVSKDNLPVIKGDLQHHARGSYSVNSYVKKANRECEQNLVAAEKLCTLAKHLTGYKYPAKKLLKAWKNVLFNQFHDIVGGCSIKKAYDDASYLYGETMSITEQEMYFAMQSVARKINTLQGQTLPAFKDPNNCKIWQHEVIGTPVVLFNPHTWPVRTMMAVNQMAKKITDHNGVEISFQAVRGGQTNLNDKYYTAFIADIPAMGYVVYRLFTKTEAEKTFENELTVQDTLLENSRLRVEFDKTSGEICKLYDKKTGEYILNTPCEAIMLDETGFDTWGHGADYLGETIGKFSEAEFEIIETGPVRATIRITQKYNNSTLRRDYSLVAGEDNVRVKTKVDFHEKHRTLKFTFDLTDETVTAKTAFGTLTKRGYTGEEPCGSWIASGKVAVANDSKYAYDTLDSKMRLTVLRSAIYADHVGVRDNLCEYMEEGVQEFSYTIFPYTTNSDAERRASELNFKPLHLMEGFHDGTLPEYFCGFKGDSDNALVSCIKEAWDKSATVIRAYEIDGKETDATFTLFGNEIKKTIKKNGIVTFTESGKDLSLTEF